MLVAHSLKQSKPEEFFEVVYDADMVVFSDIKDEEGNIKSRVMSVHKFIGGKMVKVVNEIACPIAPMDSVVITQNKIEYDF